MFKVPDWYMTMSVGLSEVLDEIGVNERVIMKRRRAYLLMENMVNINNRLSDILTTYYLGSQTEGTTTMGLQSDVDLLACSNKLIIIQDWSEWTPGLYNLLMIQDETTSPGYCLLQGLRHDVPLPETEEYENFVVRDTHGRILFKNTWLDAIPYHGQQRQGPSLSLSKKRGKLDQDTVFAFPFKSWPREARHWLNQQQGERWPTEDMKRYIQRTNCFVVGVGNKAGANEEFEWRISTSLAERCLMCNLNITQIRCYILMKMILKTYINPQHTGSLSSYMCKTVLLHCIKSKHSNIWQEHNLLACLSHCMLTLYNCITSAYCPHFTTKKNNLMAGKFSYQEKNQLLGLMSYLRENIAEVLLGIQTDDLGLRLSKQLGIAPQNQCNIQSSIKIILLIAGNLFFITASRMPRIYVHFLLDIAQKGRNMIIQVLFQTISELTRYHREGTNWEKTACTLLAPLFCATLGSMLASYNIHQNNRVCPEALAWVSAGLDSDVASSRLKLASVYYCIGEMENAAAVLRHTEERYTEFVEVICGCYTFLPNGINSRFCSISYYSNEEAIKHATAFCVRFLPSEINCIPYELQYELFRSTEQERFHRNRSDRWMDWAVVDSLPYLYFLQYKAFGHLRRNECQRQALNNLAWTIETIPNLGHRETALNLLGKCMEQENRPEDAFRCYTLSLKLRPRNNAAKIHICVLLSKLINNNI